jgi:hypothetical protein
MPIRTLAIVSLLGAASAFGCSSPAEPPTGPPTLWVTNPLCDATGCGTLQIRAFVWEFLVPQPTWGLEVVGEVEGPRGCVRFPPSWHLRVRGVDSTGAYTDSTFFTWTPEKPIFLTALDWSGGYGNQLAATETFTPADAPGWNLSFTPDGCCGNPMGARLTAAVERCESR